jgi:hypothetical protein
VKNHPRRGFKKGYAAKAFTPENGAALNFLYALLGSNIRDQKLLLSPAFLTAIALTIDTPANLMFAGKMLGMGGIGFSTKVDGIRKSNTFKNFMSDKLDLKNCSDPLRSYLALICLRIGTDFGKTAKELTENLRILLNNPGLDELTVRRACKEQAIKLSPAKRGRPKGI